VAVRTDDPRQVRWSRPGRVNDDDVPDDEVLDAEPGEVLAVQRSRAVDADDADLLDGEHGLAAVAESQLPRS